MYIDIVYSNDKWIAGRVFEHYVYHRYYDDDDGEFKYRYEPSDVDEYLKILAREGNIVIWLMY